MRSRLRSFPARPRRVRLPRRAAALGCFGQARVVAFRQRRRGFSAFVILGRRAAPSRLRQAERLLDSLDVKAVPPPRRPAWDLWPELITEAGDTMRVPPGWTAGTLAVPRRLHRPRLLFYAATEPVAGWRRGRRARLGEPRAPATPGVVAWVAEHGRGPATARFPSLHHDPFADRDEFHAWSPGRGAGATRSWRARGAWRGYRFSVTVTAGERAAEADLERAFQSASSLALSGGLRDCSRVAEERRPDLCAGAR